MPLISLDKSYNVLILSGQDQMQQYTNCISSNMKFLAQLFVDTFSFSIISAGKNVCDRRKPPGFGNPMLLRPKMQHTSYIVPIY